MVSYCSSIVVVYVMDILWKRMKTKFTLDKISTHYAFYKPPTQAQESWGYFLVTHWIYKYISLKRWSPIIDSSIVVADFMDILWKRMKMKFPSDKLSTHYASSKPPTQEGIFRISLNLQIHITYLHISMTSLLTHIIAHSTRHYFRLKTNKQLLKNCSPIRIIF